MATARHPKATFFVQRHLFAGLTSFAGLEQKIAALPDEQSRGAAFEVFAEAYLTTQRKHDAAQVWPHGSVPLDILKNLGLTQQDQGVDGVLQTLLGQFNAYQIKFRTGRPALTWRELSTFIGLADSPHIHSRVLLTNCDELPTVLNNRQGFFCIRGADLDRLEAGDFRAMEAWLADAAFVAPKKSPQPHQTEALDALLPALQTHDRVSAIMACGTGKTLVALWVAEKLVAPFGSRGATNDNSPAFQRRVESAKIASPVGTTEVSATKPSPDEDNNAPPGQPSRWGSPPMQPQPGVETPGYVSGCPVGTSAKILILLPSLALLRQTLHEWLRETRLPSLAYLCVGSDWSVKEGIDTLATEQSDLDFEVSTDPASVRGFLDAPFAGVKIIFSTYQSAHKVGVAMKPGEAFDFAVFDEAHKTAGREGRNYAFALDDKNLSIRKRLFVTATPRHYNPLAKNKDGGAQLVFSMDKPEIYGPIVYRLPFSEAAKRGIISDYKVIISEVTSDMVNDELLRRGIVLIKGEEIKARQVANQIALKSAIEKYNVSKVFTFHSRVDAAKSFTSDGAAGISNHLQGFYCDHIEGAMPTAYRERVMRVFKSAPHAILSNARCLTEGVDVPAVDMVAFLAPRRSMVDIVQATGRAMRRSPGKQFGYVLVPLYVEKTRGETIEQAVLRSNFDEIWKVLQALKEQDDLLSQIIDDMRIQRGRTGGFDDSRFRERVEIIGPEISIESLRKVITTACIEILSDSWDEYFGQLEAFRDRFGDCKVRQGWDENPALSFWVSNQRQRYRLNKLSVDRVRKLERLGFEWNAFDAAWEDFFQQLLRYKQEHDDCDVRRGSLKYRDLGNWVHGQRRNRKDGKLSVEQIRRLDEQGFVWEKFNVSWEKMFSALKKYKRLHGDCNVPHGWPKNRRLANWVRVQRAKKSDGTLSNERIRRLDDEGFIWDRPEAAWEEMFTALVAYKTIHGDCNVPARWQENPQLATWVHEQRKNWRRRRLSRERIQKLVQVGFVCGKSNPTQRKTWEGMLAELAAYQQKHGDCNVVQKWPENPELATWVGNQRRLKKEGKLSEKRICSLDYLGFVWDMGQAAWESMFAELIVYRKRRGNCEVPAEWGQNLKLGRWVSTQRKQKKEGKLSHQRIKRLNSLDFTWDKRDPFLPPVLRVVASTDE
jgi:superfamily II DNA or RNA helicase